MPHAALWVVQHATVVGVEARQRRFNAARGFVGGAARCRGACRTLCAGVSMPHAAIPFRPHHRFAVPLPRSRRGGFSFTARQLLSPMRGILGAAKARRSEKGYGILASPADAGEVASAASRWGRSCRTRLCGWCSDLSKVFDALGDEVSMPHAALWVVQL